MEKFTKGPWKAFGMEIRFPDKFSGEYVGPVASVSRINRAEHDAALIAAAPEMYEMLDSVSEILFIVGQSNAANQVVELLAKARGEQ